jgi:sugar phosphate isomerase/epimerase
MSERRYGIGYSIPNEDDYALLKLGPALDEAARLGVDYVELPLYALELLADGHVIGARLARVKSITGGRPFGYTVHGPLGLNLMTSSDAIAFHKDVLKASLELTAELGGVHYVIHAGVPPPDDREDVERRYAQQREILTEVGPFAAGRGITIAVENVFAGGEHGTLPSRLAQEIAAIGHPAVKACLDFSHAFLLANQRGADFLAEAEALAPHAKHLHLHDSFGKPVWSRIGYRAERLAFGAGDLHLPIGLGSVPWDALMQRCRFPGDVIFINELAPHYWVDLPETLAKMRHYAAEAKIGAAA